MEHSGLNNPEKWVARMLLTGSSTTNQFDRDSDIDVTVVVDFDKLRECFSVVGYSEYSNSELMRNIKDIISKINGFKIEGTNHEVNYYVVSDKKKVIDFANFDSVYDIFSGEWVVPPVLVPLDYDAESTFPEEFREATEIARSLDVELGDVRRDSEKVSHFLEKLEKVPEEDRARLRRKIEDAAKKLDRDIKNIVRIYNKILYKRRRGFQKNLDLREDGYITSRNWSPENIKYKWLERWKYIELIKEIDKIWGSKKDFKEKIKKLRNIFKVSVSTIAGFTFREEQNSSFNDTPAHSDEGFVDVLQDIRENLPTVIYAAVFSDGSHRKSAEDLSMLAHSEAAKYIFSRFYDLYGNRESAYIDGGVTLDKDPVNKYKILIKSPSANNYILEIPFSLIDPDNYRLTPEDIRIYTSEQKSPNGSLIFQSARRFSISCVPHDLFEEYKNGKCADTTDPYFSAYDSDYCSAIVCKDSIKYVPELIKSSYLEKIYFAGFLDSGSKKVLKKNGFVESKHSLVSGNSFRIFVLENPLSKRSQTEDQSMSRKKDIMFIKKMLEATCVVRVSSGPLNWTGSGFKINDTMILTCFHVLTQGESYGVDEKSFEVAFEGGYFEKVSFIKSSKSIDIGILKLSESSAYRSIEPMKMVDSGDLYPGDEIYACGSPEGIRSIVTKGIVSSKYRKIRDIEVADSFFIDLHIHPGSSGGPICSMFLDGVVGVARGSIGNVEDNGWLNYCVSSSSVMRWLEESGIQYLKG